MKKFSAIKGALTAVHDAVVAEQVTQLARAMAMLDLPKTATLSELSAANKVARTPYTLPAPEQVLKKHLAPEVYDTLSTLKDYEQVREKAAKIGPWEEAFDMRDKRWKFVQQELAKIVEPAPFDQIGPVDIYHGSPFEELNIANRGMRRAPGMYGGSSKLPAAIQKSLWASEDPILANTYRSKTMPTVLDFEKFVRDRGLSNSGEGALFKATLPDKRVGVTIDEDEWLLAPFYSKLLARGDLDALKILNSKGEYNAGFFKSDQAPATVYAFPEKSGVNLNWKRVE